VPESDVKPLELLLDLRVCYAGTVRAQLALHGTKAAEDLYQQ
jgi:hypothetical protein